MHERKKGHNSDDLIVQSKSASEQVLIIIKFKMRLLVLLCALNRICFCFKNHRPNYSRKSYSLLRESFLDKLVEKFGPKKVELPKSEDDKMLAFLEDKPWRAGKVKHLKIQYR